MPSISSIAQQAHYRDRINFHTLQDEVMQNDGRAFFKSGNSMLWDFFRLIYQFLANDRSEFTQQQNKKSAFECYAENIGVIRDGLINLQIFQDQTGNPVGRTNHYIHFTDKSGQAHALLIRFELYENGQYELTVGDGQEPMYGVKPIDLLRSIDQDILLSAESGPSPYPAAVIARCQSPELEGMAMKQANAEQRMAGLAYGI